MLISAAPSVAIRNGAVMRVMSAPVARKHLSSTPTVCHSPSASAPNSRTGTASPHGALSQLTAMDKVRAIGASRRTVVSKSMSPLVSRLRSIGSKVDSSIAAPCACASTAKLRAPSCTP